MPSIREKTDVSRSRRRTRAYRARARQQRRRSIMLTGTAALSLALASAFSIASFSGVDLANAAVQRARSFSELIDARSPGQRTLGQLSNTKHKPRVLAERAPEADNVEPTSKNFAEALTPLAPATVSIDAPPQTPELGLTAPPPGFFDLPGGGGAPPSGGSTPPGGGIVPPPGGPPGPPSPPPPNPGHPPVLPEPGTWMTMIVGFGVMGWALRRKAAPRPRSFAG